MDALGVSLGALSRRSLSGLSPRALAQDYRSGLSIGSLSDPFSGLSQGSRSGLSFKAVALQGG